MVILMHIETKKTLRFPSVLFAAQWLSLKSETIASKWVAYGPLDHSFADVVKTYREKITNDGEVKHSA